MPIPRELIIAGVLTAGIAVGSHVLFSGGGEKHRDFRDLPTFDRVAVTGQDDLVITQGKNQLVGVDGTGDELDNLKLDVVGGELRIGRRSAGGFLSWFGRSDDDDGQVKLQVTMPAVHAVSLAGSGNAMLEGVTGDRLNLRLRGSGDLKAEGVRVTALDADLAGSGDMSISGEAGIARLQLRGSGDIGAAGLSSKNVDISHKGSGDISVRSDGEAVISAGGSGDVDVIGKAKCILAKAGPGDVTCGG